MIVRRSIEQVYQAAVAAVDPRRTVRQALAGDTAAAGYAQGASEVYVIAIGKAAASMAAGVEDALGARVVSGIVVTKEPAVDRSERLMYVVGSHPVPDARSLSAGHAVLEFAAGIPDGALVLCLISGGGSALVEALQAGYDLDDLRRVTNHLLRSGAPIEDLNAVRSRLSRIKGGGLLRALEGRSVMSLIVSDVLGDNLQVIASGPTVVPESQVSAEELVERYSLDITLPAEVARPISPPVMTLVLANLPVAIDAAADAAEQLGLRPVVLAVDIQGEARDAGRIMAAVLKGSNHRLSPLGAGDCVIAGGETTVTVRGDGVGGRNTEAALAAALELRGTSGITVGFLATDGDDGVTGAAGAIVDGATISPEAIELARRALDTNDSFGFLAGTDAIWSPGATGTNVNDLIIAIIE